MPNNSAVDLLSKEGVARQHFVIYDDDSNPSHQSSLFYWFWFLIQGHGFELKAFSIYICTFSLSLTALPFSKKMGGNQNKDNWHNVWLLRNSLAVGWTIVYIHAGNGGEVAPLYTCISINTTWPYTEAFISTYSISILFKLTCKRYYEVPPSVLIPRSHFLLLQQSKLRCYPFNEASHEATNPTKRPRYLN